MTRYVIMKGQLKWGLGPFWDKIIFTKKLRLIILGTENTMNFTMEQINVEQ